MGFHELIRAVSEFLSTYGLPAMFAMMLLENLGIPLPTELAFIVGQAMVLEGRITYAEIFLVTLAGKTLGSIISYSVGVKFAKKIKAIENEYSRLKNGQKTFAGWMNKYGNFAVFISRLFGYIRPWSSYFAGVGEVKFGPFIFYNITGSALIIVLSMFVLGFVVELWRRYRDLRPTIIIVLITSFVGFWVYLGIRSLFKKKKNKD